MNSTFQSYPNPPGMQTQDFDLVLHALRARQDQVLQAIGDRKLEITLDVLEELAGLETILGDYPLEEIFHD